jgi:uncharacterized protein YbjT (DUF2867 family)
MLNVQIRAREDGDDRYGRSRAARGERASNDRVGNVRRTTMTQRDSKILVLGASGSQGGSVARHLLEAGFTNVHALVRTTDGGRASLLTGQGITLHVGDLDDIGSLDAAMQDAHGVFCVLPLDEHGPEAEIARGRNVAGAASRAGVQHFVYSSSGGADRAGCVPHFHTKYLVEQHVRGLGLPASIVRPALFMEDFTTFEHPRLVDGVAVFRAAVRQHTRRQMIAVDDIGMVVAGMFARPSSSIGQVLEIAGDELTGPQVADIYAQVTGQPARYEEQPVEEVRAFSPDFAAMFTWLNEQGFRADISRLRKDYPRLATFETWLRQHSAAVAAQP